MARVLLADDDASIRDLISEILGRDGHQVEAVATVSQAVLAYDTAPPELLILDVRMHGGGAEDILARLETREGGVRCPVIVISGDGRWDGVHPRLHAVLGKPFEMAALLQAVSSALARP